MIDKNGQLWQYLSENQKQLIQQGFYLLDDLMQHVPSFEVNDYSYVVFPFAKAYEGFLKQLFLDWGFINKHAYDSDHFRIGKALSPGLQHFLKNRSVYRQLTKATGNEDLARALWQMWKRGRNQVFHYFPHNVSALSLDEAEILVNEIIKVMEEAVSVYKKL